MARVERGAGGPNRGAVALPALLRFTFAALLGARPFAGWFKPEEAYAWSSTSFYVSGDSTESSKFVEVSKEEYIPSKNRPLPFLKS